MLSKSVDLFRRVVTAEDWRHACLLMAEECVGVVVVLDCDLPKSSSNLASVQRSEGRTRLVKFSRSFVTNPRFDH